MKQRLSAHHSIPEPAFRGIATLLNVARRASRIELSIRHFKREFARTAPMTLRDGIGGIRL